MHGCGFDLRFANSRDHQGIGAYRDDNAKPWVLPVVKKVRSSVHSSFQVVKHQAIKVTWCGSCFLMAPKSITLRDAYSHGNHAITRREHGR
jgi:aspartate/tyrosine/aromatic aminotransferase